MGVNECAQMVKTEIPTLDEDLSQYIESKLKWILILEVYFQTRGEFLYVHVNFSFLKGVLETSCEDFESGEDVFEAIGGVLQDVCDKSENEIRKLCNQLMNTLRPESVNSNGFTSNKNERKLLDAPVQMGSIASNDVVVDDAQSIWLKKDDDSLRFTDSKKLEKANKELAKKAERKENNPTTNQNRYKSNEASASQIISAKSKTELGKDIKIEGFDVAFGEKVLLKHAELSLTFGRRYGMVGRNGLGKSTLLKMIRYVCTYYINILGSHSERNPNAILNFHWYILFSWEKYFVKMMRISVSEEGQIYSVSLANLIAVRPLHVPRNLLE